MAVRAQAAAEEAAAKRAAAEDELADTRASLDKERLRLMSLQVRRYAPRSRTRCPRDQQMESIARGIS